MPASNERLSILKGLWLKGSLLGPDFHRLDRTSLRLAHSLDHLVGAGEKRRRDFEAQYPRGLEIDD